MISRFMTMKKRDALEAPSVNNDEQKQLEDTPPTIVKDMMPTSNEEGDDIAKDDSAKSTSNEEGGDITEDDSAKSTNDDAKREEARETEVAQDDDDQDGDDDVNAQGTNLTKSSSVGSTGKKRKKRKKVRTIYIHLHLRVPLPRSHHDSFVLFLERKSKNAYERR